MTKNIGVARNCVLALLAAAMLASCGGGGNSDDVPTGTTVIRGVVSDDAIVGATVTATSLDTGLALGTGTTTADGSFAINVATNSIGSGYGLRSAGGAMNGVPFEGNLLATYPRTWVEQSSNLTLITTALVEAANSTAQYPGGHLQKHEAIKTDAIRRGVLPSDYSLIEPPGFPMAGYRNQVASQGLSVMIGDLAQVLGSKPLLGGCGEFDSTCTRDVSPLGERLAVSLQGATVSAPASTLTNCRVVVEFDAKSQFMTVRLENIPPTTGNQTVPIPCKAAGDITLALPESPAQAPDACIHPAKRSSSMQHCVTVGSGITPSYSVFDQYSHRTDSRTHISKAQRYKTVKLSRGFGATLASSDSPSSGQALNQWAGKTAVIFVHGYKPGGGFGGDDDTWGVLPKLVAQYRDDSFVALNFQWRTDASYLTVATELAKAVDYAKLSTGKKVHVIAHSFGGVLARVMLQNLTDKTSESAVNVATLTTVGTPHSGIVDNTDLFSDARTVEEVPLPKGWGSYIPDKWCGQISCYQSGRDAGVAEWAKDSLAEVDSSGVAKVPEFGYITARLGKPRNKLPRDLKVLVLIGQLMINQTPPKDAMFHTSDGLITYHGQRFFPQIGRNSLLLDTVVVDFGGATVTERILGLDAGVDAFPGDPLKDEIKVTDYARPGLFTTGGYKHSDMKATFVTGGPVTLTAKREVFVPEDCGTPDTCKHDTWVNLREVLKTNTALCVAPQILKNGFCVMPPALPVIEFTASPSSIASGETSLLRWTSSHSTSCASSGGGGSGNVGAFSTPSLTTSTTYTVTCTGVAGSASQSVTVTVAAPLVPTVTFTATPSVVGSGATSTLRWTSTNSTYCYSSDGSYGTGTEGEFTTPPLTASTTYTVTCAGAGRTVSQSVIVTVVASPLPTVSLAATPSAIASGATSALAWTSTRSTSCFSAGGGGTGTAGGFTTPPLTATTTYTVTCTGAGGSASQSVTVTVAPLVPASLLTDTGVTSSQCYQAGSDVLVSCTSAAAIALNSKQDGMIGRDVTTPDSSDGKLGFSYSAVGSHARTECVKDNLTGLTWEGKPTSGLRANTNMYTNYGDGRAGDASAYVAAVNATALCGYTDWRLPIADELQSIVDYGVAWPGPAVDAGWFPNTVNLVFWSSSSFLGVGVVNHAWYVNLGNGGVAGYTVTRDMHVRLVR
ncbi:MAG: DUF1566 domain-containing protein [Hylemonella sp.]|nr:DUF1566 domain-containing protein [Hylemonella sp.]